VEQKWSRRFSASLRKFTVRLRKLTGYGAVSSRGRNGEETNATEMGKNTGKRTILA